MATKVNRAATSATKKGGRSSQRGVRNKTTQLNDRHRSLNMIENRRAFNAERHETLSRHHNATMGIPGLDQHFSILSDGFADHERIPKEYTQDGENYSPPFSWSCPNLNAQEFVLICEDVSVQEEKPIVHWLMYRIPGGIRSLPERILPGEIAKNVPGSPLQGLNDFGKLGYEGPFPPLYDGWHEYRFRLLALSTHLKDLRPGMTRDELFQQMKRQVLQEVSYIGRYRRTRGTLKGIPGAD